MAQSDAQRTGPDTARPPRATRREWIGLAVIALPCLLYAMDLTVLTLALPAISADLRPSSTELLWIVDIYGFLVAGFLITMGTLGDRIGRRRLLLAGAASFGAASVIAAFALGAAFIDRQRRLADPMIDLGLFRRPAFSLALSANTLAFAVVFGIEVFVAQYFQLVLGYSPLEAGLWSVPGAAAFVVGSQLTPALAARVRPPVAMLGGIAVATVGVAMLTQVGAGGALGLAILGTIGTAVYRDQATFPASVPDGARDTLAGAVAVADRMPQAAA